MRSLDHKEKLLAHILRLNPWSDVVFLSHLSGLSVHATRRGLANRAVFDRIRVHRDTDPGSGPRRYLFDLTSHGAYRLGGGFQSIAQVAGSLAVSMTRLAQARAALITLGDEPPPAWVISPWWPAGRAFLIDALANLQDPDAACSRLVALLVAPPSADPDWYAEQRKRWQRLTARMPRCRAIQLAILDEHPNAASLDPAPPENGNAAFIARDARQLRARLSRPAGRFVNETTRHSHVPEHFCHRMPRTRVKGYRDIAAWLAGGGAERFCGLQALLALTGQQRRLLWTVAQFPAVDLQKLRAAGMIAVSGRSQRRAVSVLLEMGLFVQAQDIPNAYCISDRGVDVLARAHGVPSAYLNRALGNPARVGQFVHQRAHNEAVQAFMLALTREGAARDWRYMAARYVFAQLRVPGRGKGQRRVVVIPDSSATFVSSRGAAVPFWLEVDRATRRGKRRIKAQVEKYFAIQYARLASAPVPPLLFLVDAEPKKEKARLRLVIRCFAELAARRYPQNQLVVLFAVAQAVKERRGALRELPVWLMYRHGRVHEQLVSLDVGLPWAWRMLTGAPPPIGRRSP